MDNENILIGACCDSDKGIFGRDYFGCSDHRNLSQCGRYDNEVFEAGALCCICGGGETCKGMKH